MSKNEVTFFAVMSNMTDTSFQSFALPHELSNPNPPLDRRSVSVSLTLRTDSGEVGEVVLLEEFYDVWPNQVFSDRGIIGLIPGACWQQGEFWIARNIGAAFGVQGWVLAPAIVNDSVYCSRLTVPIGVVVTQGELESIKKMDARVVVESR